MANLRKIVYLTEAQKTELFNMGSVTSNGVTITYNENDLYITPDESINAIQLNGISYTPSNGVVNLGTVLTSHQDTSGKADKVASATAGNFAALDSSGNLVDSGHKHSDYTLTTLYRQFWTSNDSISLTLASDGKTYYIWCAASSSGTSGAMSDESYGAFIFVSNGQYAVLHKGTEITVDETSSVLTITSTANIAMAIVEI